MIQPLEPLAPINFGYKSILKDKYLSGELPLKKGFYGGELFKSADGKRTNCTLEHLQPRSLGGKNKLSNYVIATLENNNKRDNSPLSWFINFEAMEEYLKEVDAANIPQLKGYSIMIRKTVEQILEQEKKQGIKLNILI